MSAGKEAAMNVSPYGPVKASLQIESGDVAPALWNPDVAGVWSMFFTPIFGSILVLKNWQAIGEESLAKTGRVWLIVSIFMLIPSGFVPLLGFLYILIWYFAWQKKQTKYIEERWAKNYPKKKWGVPVLIGIGGVVVYSILLVLIGTLTSQPERIENIRFGTLKKAGGDNYEIDIETITIPKKIEGTGFRFGISFDNPTGQAISYHVVSHLPAEPSKTTGDLSESATRTYTTPTSSSRKKRVVYRFWFDEGDPLGTYSMDLYVHNQIIHSVTFEVVEPE
jgi:heme/copper-type cytochrome/quinol oxidase subunit 2